ncbi:MAG: hypothetical protein QMC79_08635 [Anaerosomatales bacterium]|nr:hypothetical protein [Anaerosomatales bacterium]
MRKILFLAAVSLVLTLAVAGVAYGVIPEAPYDTNEDCLACHDVAADVAAAFSVDFTSSVDLDRCWACHYQSNHFKPLWGYPVELYPLGCRSCHYNFPSEAGRYFSEISTPYGWFTTASSPYTDASELHSIHVNGDWVAEPEYYAFCAARCHGKAACSACHGPDEGVGHGEHTGGVYPAVTYTQSIGAGVVSTAVTCVNSACHSLGAASSDAFVPDCGACHPGHEDVDSLHVSSSSQECVDCHETADVRELHASSPAASCDRCHTGGTLPASVECAACHGGLSPIDPNHYPSDAHLASASAGCRCHSRDLYTEHLKFGVGCVQCHESSVDTFATAWDKTCDACHPVKHGATGTWSGGGGRRW